MSSLLINDEHGKPVALVHHEPDWSGDVSINILNDAEDIVSSYTLPGFLLVRIGELSCADKLKHDVSLFIGDWSSTRVPSKRRRR